jgi:diaminopropionate ammonia-lyase
MEILTINNGDYFINRPDNKIPENKTTEILRESKAIDYHRSLAVYQPTPLLSIPELSKKYGIGEIFVKDESTRFGLKAFKGLGASYAIHQLVQKPNNISTFCTATDGNHGRAVAWASKLEGRKSVIFVPKDTTQKRIASIEEEGGKVIKTDLEYDETVEIAANACNKEGWQLVQDTSWEGYEEIPALIMAGYLTLLKEMETDLHTLPKPNIDIVFLQAGAGSWAGAAIWYYLNRYGKNRPKIVVVEPNEANGIFESFRAGKRVKPKGNYKTIMAGLNCGIPSMIAWELINNGTDVSMRIHDEYAERAMRELYYPPAGENDQRVIAGESGAGGLAGFIALMTNLDFHELREELQITEKSRVLFFNTEGATDPDSFNKIVNDRFV